MAEEKQLVDFVTEDGSTYKTLLTEKMERRKVFKRNDPRKVEAVIPGKVTEIFVKEGDIVKVGMPLLVLESMKMGNLIKSAAEGRIKHVFVEKGEHISKGEMMIELE